MTSSDSQFYSDVNDSSCIREFRCSAKILGHDGIQLPECSLDDMLCDLCSLFVKDCLTNEQLDGNFAIKNDHRQVYRHYSTLRRLVRSSEAGCKLCSVLLSCRDWNDISRVSISLQSSGDAFSIHALVPHSEAFKLIQIGAFDPEAFKLTKIGAFEFVLAEDTSECLEVLRTRHALEYPHTSLDECSLQIKDWYDDCSYRHLDCQRRFLPMPGRLIDISSGDRDCIKLIEPESSAKIPYVTLSYCWGKETSIRTTKANIEDLKQAIAFELLPCTVQDAIIVCLKHGFKYLWVDRLCICQDDEDDWQKEAKNLANIFGGCVLTIASLSTSCVTQPFLRPREFLPIQIGKAVVSYGNRSEQSRIFIRRQPRSLDDELNCSRWVRRGWTFQERILAPAVLHFGRDQIMWECGTDHLRSETGEVSRDHKRVIRLERKLVSSDDFGVKPLWASIVESFSKREFTFEKDRLLALAGISSKLREDKICVSSYAAGMWEDALEFQLVWRSEEMKEQSSIKTDDRFPTWSWLHQHIEVDLMIHYVPASALPVPPKFVFDNETDALRSIEETVVYKCNIELRGFVQKITKRALTMDSQPQPTKWHITRYFGLPGDGSSLHLDREITASGPFFALRILESARYDDGNIQHEPIIYYLLLQQATKSYCGNLPGYCRLGVLILIDLPDAHFNEPFPDVHCRNGRQLLTNGEWQDIVLL